MTPRHNPEAPTTLTSVSGGDEDTLALVDDIAGGDAASHVARAAVDSVLDRAIPSDEDRAATRRKVLNRLRRARGQLDAVIRAVEADAPCRGVITQLSATTSALQRAGFTIVSGAMRECVADSEDPGAEMEELERLFLSLS